MLSFWFPLTVALVAIMVFFALRRVTGWRPRAVLVGLLAIVMVTAFVGTADLMGRPRPTRIEVLNATPDARVLYARLRAPTDILLLLEMPEMAEPRYYTLAWDQKLADQLRQALSKAEREGNGEVRMRSPFEPSWDDREPRFYHAPQPAPPPKGDPPAPPVEYRHPGQDA